MNTDQMKEFARAYSVVRAYGSLHDPASKSMFAEALAAIDNLCNPSSSAQTQNEAAIRLSSIVTVPSNQNGYDIVLRHVPAWTNKIPIIKAVREKTGLSLKGAKELVDRTPSLIVSNMIGSQALILKALLESFGAQIDMPDHSDGLGRRYKVIAEDSVPTIGTPAVQAATNSRHSLKWTPTTFVRERSFQSFFKVGEERQDAYDRFIRFFEPDTCNEFLKSAANRVDGMNAVLCDGERMLIDVSIFRHPVCGMPFDVVFTEHETASDILLQFCPNTAKIALIKEMRCLFGGQLGLKESKDIVDGIECRLTLGISRYLANEMMAKMEVASPHDPIIVSVVNHQG